MCDVISGEEQTVDFPSSLFHRRNGFAIDFGGSGLKMAYTTEVGQMVRFHLIIYPRERMNEAFDSLKRKIEGKIDEETTVYLTGFGCNQYGQVIKKKLHKNTHMVEETRCLIDAIKFFLKNFPVEQLCYGPSEEAMVKADELSKVWQARLQRFGANDMHSDELHNGDLEIPHKKSDIFPCAMSVVGSSAFLMQVNKDESFQPKGTVAACGKYLLGMGSIITGAKSFEELMQLAERGDDRNIDIYSNHLNLETPSLYEDIIQTKTTEQCLFRFGHAVGKDKDDFEREDLAAALVTHLAETLAMVHHQVALLSDSRHIFVCGSLASNSPLMRKKIEEHFRLNAAVLDHGRSWKPDIHFVKYGGFMGCIGALLKTLQQ